MLIDTPRGPARVHIDQPESDSRALLMLGHGAGGGVQAGDLLAVRDASVSLGLTVVRVEQPYRVAGRRAPAPAAHLDEAWNAVAAALTSGRREIGTQGEVPLITGGRSSGARVACRTADRVGALGVLALAFPLHPPGRPDRSRAGELAAVDVPVLVINGDRDPFGVPEPSGRVTVRVMQGEKHALSGSPATVGDWAGHWLEGLLM